SIGDWSPMARSRALKLGKRRQVAALQRLRRLHAISLLSNNFYLHTLQLIVVTTRGVATLALRILHWQGQRKHRACISLAFNRNFSSVQFGDFAHQSQT